jgi:hypothetical protein
MLFQGILVKSSEQRRVILPTALPFNVKAVDESGVNSSSSSSSPASSSSLSAASQQEINGIINNSNAGLYSAISLEIGSRCVRNVIALLNSNLSSDLVSGAANQLSLRIAANVNGAYIALASDNPAVALK